MPGNGWAGGPSPVAVPDEQRPRLMAHRRRWSFSHVRLDLEEKDRRRHRDCRQQQQLQENKEEGEEEGEEEEQRPHSHCRHWVDDTGRKRVGAGFGRWSSYCYYRLPPQQLRLTILKLDGSSFAVHVMRSASVSELRLAVEEVFARSPTNDEGDISWSHVWGHFCLCYSGHKLIDDKTFLRTLGIKDGDELHFIRHLSISYNPVVKQHPRKNLDVYEQQKIHVTGPGVNRGSQSEKDEIDSGDYSSFFVDENYEDDDQSGDLLIAHPEFKLAHFSRGWLSYCGLWCSGRTSLRTRVRPFRLGNHCPEVGKRWKRLD